MSDLSYQMAYSTWEFRALQLRFLVVLGDGDYPLASCMSFHFSETVLSRSCFFKADRTEIKFGKTENTSFIVFISIVAYLYTYALISLTCTFVLFSRL